MDITPLCIHLNSMNCFNSHFLPFYNELKFHVLSRNGKMLAHASHGIKISISSKSGHSTFVLSTVDILRDWSKFILTYIRQVLLLTRHMRCLPTSVYPSSVVRPVVIISVTISKTDKSQLGLCSVLALKSAGFSLADVQSDVILPLCLHVTAFSMDQLLSRWRFVISLTMCQWGAASSRWSQRLVSWTGSCTMYTRSCISPQIL